MSKVTKATFPKRLAANVTADNGVAGECQNLIEFAHEHFKSSGDTRYFASIINAGYRASRKDAMVKYIVAHTNLKCQKVDPKDLQSDMKFVKNDKSANKTATIPLTVDKKTGNIVTWYDYTQEKIQLDFDIDQAVKSLIARAQGAIEGGDGKPKLKGTKKHAQTVVAQLRELVAA